MESSFQLLGEKRETQIVQIGTLGNGIPSGPVSLLFQTFLSPTNQFKIFYTAFSTFLNGNTEIAQVKCFDDKYLLPENKKIHQFFGEEYFRFLYI